MSWAICCSRSCSIRRWRASRARSRSTTSSTRSATRWNGVTRMSSAMRGSTTRRRRRSPGRSRSGASAQRSGASVLADVPLALPALTRANKLGKRAAQVGFEWPNVSGALDKLDEELGELRKELGARRRAQAEIADELGDVLFCVVNVCRYLEIDPEAALRGANAKFERRFGYVEQRLQRAGTQRRRSDTRGDGRLWDEGKAPAEHGVGRRIRTIQGSFMPLRLPCAPSSALSRVRLRRRTRCVRLVVCWCWRVCSV